jgi:uncharacterized protein YodC (DUF2158 family)
MQTTTHEATQEPTATQCRGTFKPGDRVMLNSGGPSMTVIDIGRETGLAFCRWTFRQSGEVHEAHFPEAAIRIDYRSLSEVDH